MMRKLSFGVVALLLGASSAVAGVEDFKLARALPADAMMVVSARDHDGLDFINEQMERVWDAIERQHFENDIKRLIKRSMPDGESAEFDKQWQQLRDLSAGVHWRTLCQREMAYALRVGPPMGSEWVLLFRPAAEHVESDFSGLSAMAKHFAGLLGDEGTLDTEETGPTVVHRLSLGDGPVIPIFTLARHKDVILFGFGTGLPEQTLALLRGETDASTGAIVSQPRFRAALEKLPEPEDVLMYIDTAAMMRQARQFAQMAAGSSEQASMLPKLVEMIDMWDYVATVATTDGMSTRSHAVCLLHNGKGDAALRKAFYGNQPIEKPFRYIPRNAKTFSVGNGANWWGLYESLLTFARENVPGGPQAVEQMKMQMATLPVDIEHIIRSLEGPYVSFTAPGASSYATPHNVMMLKVKDAPGMQETLDKIQKLVAEMPELREQNTSLEDLNQPGTEGFKMLMLQPMFAMMIGQPCIGLHEGWLVITNGPQAVKLVVDLSAGEAESFVQSAAYEQDGLAVKSGITGYSYSDLSRWHEETSAMLQMLPSIVQMASMFSGENIMKEPVVGAMLTALGKAGRVVGECNFYKSSFTQTTFEDGVERTVTVTHYRKPPEPLGKPVSPSPASDSENTGR